MEGVRLPCILVFECCNYDNVRYKTAWILIRLTFVWVRVSVCAWMTELCLVCRDQDAVAASVLWSQHWPVAQNKNDASLSLSLPLPPPLTSSSEDTSPIRERERNFGRLSHCVAIDTVAHSALLPKSMADSRWERWEFCVCMCLHMCVCVCVKWKCLTPVNMWGLLFSLQCVYCCCEIAVGSIFQEVLPTSKHVETHKHTLRSAWCFGFVIPALILLHRY